MNEYSIEDEIVNDMARAVVEPIPMAGTVKDVRIVFTKKQERMATIQMDWKNSASGNLVIFPRSFMRYGHVFIEGVYLELSVYPSDARDELEYILLDVAPQSTKAKMNLVQACIKNAHNDMSIHDDLSARRHMVAAQTLLEDVLATSRDSGSLPDALAHYHTHYNNVTYKRARTALLEIEKDDDDFLNLMIDACIEVSADALGFGLRDTHYHGKFLDLMLVIQSNYNQHLATVVGEHLENFRDAAGHCIKTLQPFDDNEMDGE